MTATRTEPTQLAALFRRLADQWQRETLFLSSTTAIVLHPAYQRIIGLGPQVLPLIFTELQHQPAHWFWALEALTGENPVPEADRGNVPAMTQAWLAWSQGKVFTHESPNP